jgi:hypothetical protein
VDTAARDSDGEPVGVCTETCRCAIQLGPFVVADDPGAGAQLLPTDELQLATWRAPWSQPQVQSLTATAGVLTGCRWASATETNGTGGMLQGRSVRSIHLEGIMRTQEWSARRPMVPRPLWRGPSRLCWLWANTLHAAKSIVRPIGSLDTTHTCSGSPSRPSRAVTWATACVTLALVDSERIEKLTLGKHSVLLQLINLAGCDKTHQRGVRWDADSVCHATEQRRLAACLHAAACRPGLDQGAQCPSEG